MEASGKVASFCLEVALVALVKSISRSLQNLRDSSVLCPDLLNLFLYLSISLYMYIYKIFSPRRQCGSLEFCPAHWDSSDVPGPRVPVVPVVSGQLYDLISFKARSYLR